MRRPTLILALLLALLAPLLPVTPALARAEAIAWAPCPQDPTAECGTLAVPIDWNNPAAGTFDLALARRKATNPGARIGSLVINPGGPGGSGVQAVIQGWLPFTPDITTRFDVVGFDPRGVGLSRPILCSIDVLIQEPDPVLKSQADFDARLVYNERLRQDCRLRTGPLFDHVDTGSVVRDLDALRAALGDDKLTYYGISYGTLIGQLYAERFPGRVRALALDSNMDHSLGTAAFLDTESWTAQDSFNEFVSWCGKASDCALHGRDIRAFFADLVARADRGELHYPGIPEFIFTKLSFLYQVLGAFYGPAWAQLADFLVAVDTGAASATSALGPPLDRAQEVVNVATQVFCLDFDLPIRDYRDFSRHVRRSKHIAPDMEFSPLALSITVSCLGTKKPIPNPQHRLKVDGTPKLLVGNTLHDPATAYPWAVSTALQIGREARLLTHEGWGHGIYGNGPCATTAIDRYLITRAVPAFGARCPAVSAADVRTRRTPPPVIGPIPGLPGWEFTR